MRLYKDVVNLILDFIPKYKLRDWIDEKKLDWRYLSQNPLAINLIEKNLEEGGNKVDWTWLSYNPAAIHILEKNQDKVTR
jgi:hypothetical protein